MCGGQRRGETGFRKRRKSVVSSSPCRTKANLRSSVNQVFGPLQPSPRWLSPPLCKASFGLVPICLCALSPLTLSWRSDHGRKEGKNQRLELESTREKTFPQRPARTVFPSLLPSASLLNHIQNTPVIPRPSSLNGGSLSF